SGWSPVSKAYETIAVDDAAGGPQSITVNRYVVQKGLDRQSVLYWYQGRGRVVASEYLSKFFLVYDALRFNRSDAALVRVVSPRLSTSEDGDREALARAVAFVMGMFPALHAYLPS